MPVTTTRQKILSYLKRNRTVSSRELARALQMTPANARHHLGILTADGRVEVVAQRRGGRGRPEKVYRLAGTLVGDNLSALVDALLTEANGTVQMDAVAKRMAAEEKIGIQPLARQLGSVVDYLNKKSYQAHWEAGAAGPRIIFGHCPYAAVITKHPELCEMDAALLKELLGKDVVQNAKMEPKGGVCIFQTR